ncbi:MAG: MATE family efflux transporter [Spirochaetota bacterium]
MSEADIKTEKSPNPIEDKGFVRNAVTIAIPSMIAFMIDYSYQLVDTFWVSQLGLGAPTAVLIASTILLLFMSLNNIVSSSTIPIFSQTFGSGDKEKTGYVILQGILFKLALGILAAVLYLFVINNMLFLYTDNAMVIDKIKSYGNIIFMSLVIMLPYGSMLTGLRTINEAPKTMIISIICASFNIILDPILIFGIGILDPIINFFGISTFESIGKAEMFKMGIEGAALATVLTQLLGMILATIILINNREGIKVFKIKHLIFDKRLYIKMLTIGLPVGMVSFIWNIEQNVIASVIESYGILISDGFGIAVKIRGLFVLGMFGLSLGTALACGKYIGAERFDIIRRDLKKLALGGAFMMGLICVPIIIFANPILELFTNVSETVEYGALFLRFFAVLLIIICVRFIFEGPFKGAGKNIPVLIVNAFIMILIEVPLVFVIGQFLHIDIIYLVVTILITNFINMLVFYFLFRTRIWEKPASIH